MQAIIQNYLDQNSTSDSLFIDGEWGVGKTYFLKSYLYSNDLEKESRPIIYISLNGVSSNDELKSLILAKSIIGVDEGVSKSLLSKIKEKLSTLLSKADFGQFLFPSFNIADFFEMESAIYVFDDLERIAESYSVSSVLAIINSDLVEYNGFKVIIIGNSIKIREQSKFKVSKEKTIGWTVKFKSDFDITIPSILAGLKEIDQDFYSLIHKEEEFILNMVKYLDLYNLRSVKRSLDYLRKIVDSLDKQTLILRDVIYFTFIINHEIRRGNIGGEAKAIDLPSFVKNGYNISYPISKDVNVDVKLKYEDYSKYLSNQLLLEDKETATYFFFESIFSFIQSGYFDTTKFKEESSVLTSKKERIKKSPASIKISRIQSYFYLENTEFNTLKKDIISIIENGDLDFYEFLRISRFLFQLKTDYPFLLDDYDVNDILTNNVDEIISKPISEKFFVLDFERVIGDIGSLPVDLYEKLYRKIEHFTNVIISKKNKNLLIELEKKPLTQTDLRELILTIDESDIAEKLILNIKNRKFLDLFLRVLEKSYNSSNAGDLFIKDAEKLKQVMLIIEKKNDTEEFLSIDKVWIIEIINKLKIIIKHINSTRTKPH